MVAFERMLWRVCRGNVFLKQAEIPDLIEDPATVCSFFLFFICMSMLYKNSSIRHYQFLPADCLFVLFLYGASEFYIFGIALYNLFLFFFYQRCMASPYATSIASFTLSFIVG